MKNLIYGLTGAILLMFINGELVKTDKELLEAGYRGREGMTQKTVALKLIGAKKAGAGLLWVNQVVVVGDNLGVEDVDIATSTISEGSEKISYLDPYFVGNYQFSGSILAFIRIYRRYDLAMDIFQRGIAYNPESEVLKRYMAGTLASSRGNMLEMLKSFEGIVEKTRDDLLINTLAFTYEQAYEKTQNEELLKRSIYYWRMLLTSKDSKYSERAVERIQKYTDH